MCLSKGLGAPVGSVLVGTASFIDAAKRWRKMLGGGLRQAGILAAAGIYALRHNRDRLSEDHAMAAALGAALDDVPGVTTTAVNTNMVFCDFSRFDGDVAAAFARADILAAVGPASSRLVTHLDLPSDTPERVYAALTA